MNTMRNIKKSFKDRLILDLEGFKLKEGAIHVIFGDNGAGKTTLLKILAGLSPADEAVEPLQKCTMVMQKPFLFRGTVRSNLAYPLELRKLPTAQIEGRIKTMANDLGIEGLLEYNAKKLSGGEAQKVNLARALLCDPEVLLLDEPTASIDRKSTRMIEEQILKYQEKHHSTVLLVTHNMDQARRLGQYIYILEEGKLYETDETDVDR